MTSPTPPQGRYGWLAGALVLLAVMYPALGRGETGQLAWTAVFWLVLLGCLRTVAPHASIRVLARVLGWFAISGSIASLWCFSSSDTGHGLAYAIIHGLSLMFLAVTMATTLWDVFGHARVTGQTLLGAACGYVLLGMTFAFTMLVLHSVDVDPLAWADMETSGSEVTARYLYFSFVTLSTLGYGDMVPQSSVAEVLASAEAIIGQLYLAVFIGRLIAMHVASPRRCPHCGSC